MDKDTLAVEINTNAKDAICELERIKELLTEIKALSDEIFNKQS